MRGSFVIMVKKFFLATTQLSGNYERHRSMRRAENTDIYSIVLPACECNIWVVTTLYHHLASHCLLCLFSFFNNTKKAQIQPYGVILLCRQACNWTVCTFVKLPGSTLKCRTRVCQTYPYHHLFQGWRRWLRDLRVLFLISWKVQESPLNAYSLQLQRRTIREQSNTCC